MKKKFIKLKKFGFVSSYLPGAVRVKIWQTVPAQVVDDTAHCH